MGKCMYCKAELHPEMVLDVCMSCGSQIWGGKMFASIIENMENARSTGNLHQGLVTEHESAKREVIKPVERQEDRILQKPDAVAYEDPLSDSEPQPTFQPTPTFSPEPQDPAPSPTPQPPQPEPQPDPEPLSPQQSARTIAVPAGIKVPSLFQDAIAHQQNHPREEPPASYEEAEAQLRQEQALSGNEIELQGPL